MKLQFSNKNNAKCLIKRRIVFTVVKHKKPFIIIFIVDRKNDFLINNGLSFFDRCVGGFGFFLS